MRYLHGFSFREAIGPEEFLFLRSFCCVGVKGNICAGRQEFEKVFSRCSEFITLLDYFNSGRCDGGYLQLYIVVFVSLVDFLSAAFVSLHINWYLLIRITYLMLEKSKAAVPCEIHLIRPLFNVFMYTMILFHDFMLFFYCS